MDNALLDEVTREVRRRLDRPAALLIGNAPTEDLGWRYVDGGAYSAVMIGSMSACALLHFPDEVCTEALLLGTPVYLWEAGLQWHKSTANRALLTRLLAAQRQMKQLGVQFLSASPDRLLTAEEVRRRLSRGLPVTGRLTPLARDVLEGRA